MQNTMGWRGALVLAMTAVAGCSDDEPAGPRVWDSCQLRATDCACVIRESGSELEFPPGDSCGGFNCCLLDDDAMSTAASCTCSDVEDCDDVAERAGTTVVAQCPPPGEVLSERATCVPESETCPNRPGSTSSGCCGGLLCLSDGESDPQRVCTAVEEEDRERAQQCERATLDGREWIEVTAGAVETSHGRLSFEHASLGSSFVGPGGCVTTIQMGFVGPTRGTGPDGGVASCSLELDAELRNGEWVLRRVLGALDACAGYSGPAGEGVFDISAPEDIAFGFSHETQYCGAQERPIASDFCASGTFDWELSGAVGGVMFEGSHLRAKGVVCGISEVDTCVEVSARP